MRAHWMKSQKESMRLEEAGLGGDVLDSALGKKIKNKASWDKFLNIFLKNSLNLKALLSFPSWLL